MKKNLIHKIALALTLTIGATAVSPSVVKAEDLKSTQQEYTKLADNLSQEDLEIVLRAVSEIPDDLLLNGSEEDIQDFMIKRGVAIEYSDNERSVLSCAGAIAWAIGSAAFGAAMLIKIKKFVKAAGGVKKAAAILISIAQNGVTEDLLNYINL